MNSTKTQQQQRGIDVMTMRYLAFGGGGGKGMANVGVLLALEQLGLLPVKIDIANGRNQANNKILGVSGASAGAFTSFCIALGFTAQDLMDLFREYDFTMLFEKPDIGKARMVKNRSYAVYDTAKVFDKSLLEQRLKELKKFPLPPSLYKTIESAITDLLAIVSGINMLENIGADAIFFGAIKDDTEGFGGSLAKNMAVGTVNMIGSFMGGPFALSKGMEILHEEARKKLEELADATPEYAAIINVIAKKEDFYQFLYNILYDRGIFPGFEVRRFLFYILCKFLQKNKQHFPEWSSIDFSNSALVSDEEMTMVTDNLDFTKFYRLTGVHLNVTGVNITTGTPTVFSMDTEGTPAFPVLDAVAISMCFPIAFKPVIVTDSHGFYKRLNGLWIDGGVINNLPLNVFNSRDGRFNEQVLGFTLMPGKEKSLFEICYKGLTDIVAPKHVHLNERDAGMYGTLTKHLGDSLFKSQRYYSEMGQIQYSETSRDNVIDIYASYLSTLEFIPYAETIIPPVVNAYYTVFRKAGLIAKESVIKEFIKLNHPRFKSMQRSGPPPKQLTEEHKNYRLKVKDYIAFMRRFQLEPVIKDKSVLKPEFLIWREKVKLPSTPYDSLSGFTM